MKIAIQDQIIDTDNIYQVTEVRKDYDEPDYICYFYIILYGKHYVTFGLTCKEFNIRAKKRESESDYNQFITEMKQSVENLRQKVIAEWAKSQSNIPKLELE